MKKAQHRIALNVRWQAWRKFGWGISTGVTQNWNTVSDTERGFSSGKHWNKFSSTLPQNYLGRVTCILTFIWIIPVILVLELFSQTDEVYVRNSHFSGQVCVWMRWIKTSMSLVSESQACEWLLNPFKLQWLDWRSGLVQVSSHMSGNTLDIFWGDYAASI